MVKAGQIYIDSTEVTVAEYAAFLVASGDDTSLQSAECAWNYTFEPSEPGSSADHPVTHVDFCDAAAFCAWADKRLCGHIGGGPLLFEQLSLASESQWFAACAGPNAQLYPYGAVHQDGACNDASSASSQVVEVGSFEGCQGYYDGVYDMLGNVAEWVDACDAVEGAVDGCEVMGGSYADSSTCTSSSLKHRNEQLPTLGFRCCGP
jgi:formylglycine-generating enzyme required for sulfatase activity